MVPDVVYGAETSFVSARVRGASAVVVTPSVVKISTNLYVHFDMLT